MISVSKHYDLLIENGNDPVLDGKLLSEYMNKWDGEEFINLLDLDKNKTVLEIGCGTGRIAKKIVDLCKIYVGIDVSQKTIAVLSIDKNQQTYINTSYSRITIFPDAPNTICGLLRQIGFSNIEVKEIEFAHIISCIKN